MSLLSRRFAVSLVAATASLSLASCAGLLGGGGKPPPYLFTLTPEAPEPTQIVRASSAAQAVTIGIPITPKELRAVRVPVQANPVNVQYVANLQLVDTPDRLFADLVAETVRRTTNRIVLDPRQSSLDPGVTISGELQRFGYDTASGQVVVQYDANMSRPGNNIQTRRFTATAPADGTAATVGAALNRAANQVATDVATWIGSSAG